MFCFQSLSLPGSLLTPGLPLVSTFFNVSNLIQSFTILKVISDASILLSCLPVSNRISQQYSKTGLAILVFNYNVMAADFSEPSKTLLK